MSVHETTIDQLTQDAHNANAGTERGRYMLDHSLRQYGAGRSILVDKNGRVIAGNKTLEVAADIGLDDVIVVETDGNKLVAVKRTDLDLEDGDRARLLAYADNRASDVGLAWDAEAIQFDLEAGIDLSDMFHEEEIESIVKDRTGGQVGPIPELAISPELFERHDYLVFYFDNEFDWQVACEMFEVGQVLCGKVGQKTLEQKGMGRVVPGGKLLAMMNDD